ncbi:hypothetical protein MKO06_06640 [Gramella sp. GC03-9]|uniref:Uncharacterized protein n=1 Tax=Christiangramia oceanisediminis TaxID=2920386 RepID=A0A9X2KXF3_9FLAO|nr:hypothetical protein [Gramella oceanisediminis]MCP9199576.1 hypothetical protein [Gramella oceanisediminis]
MVQDDRILKNLKLWVWIYFFLLIFEGALRKWILPQLSEPILIIRDPVAIFIIYKAIKEGYWKPGPLISIIVFVTILSTILALIIGHGNIFVALYGFRITGIHFPLIFAIGKILEWEDVVKIGKVTLWLTIGMTILVGLQFFSPQSAWVNRGIGGDLAGSGFSGAAGFYRVPGTFSFTNGLSFFYGLASAFIIYFWMNGKKDISKILLTSATIALLAAIPLSISRSVLFHLAVTLVFCIAISRNNPAVITRIITIGVFGMILLVVLNNFEFFRTATGAFSERFTNANRSEGGVEGVFIDRFLGGMYNAITDDSFAFWGNGLGMGTNAGAKIMTGKREFLLAEGEWGRIIGEMGLILGLLIILIRGGVVLQLIVESWRSVKKSNILPWLLMSFGMFIILQGQWAQPTALGFSVLAGGLIIASTKQASY